MYGPACECTVPFALLDKLTWEQHVAFHVGDVEAITTALEVLCEAGVDEEVLEEIAGSYGLLAN